MHQRDEPPFVQALILRVSGGVGRTVRGALAAVGRRTLMIVWAASTLVILVSTVGLSIARARDLGETASGIFAGVFFSLLFAAAFGWLLISVLVPASTPAYHTAEAAELESLLAPILRELDAVRADVARQVKQRSVTRVPLGAAGGLLLWVVSLWGDDPPGLFELLIFSGVGAIAGEVWAIGHLDRDYRRRYKDQVLPRLAARFGDLVYRHASTPNIRDLHESRILKDFDHAIADDEIAGTHRGLPVSIVEVCLKQGSGDDERTVFDGLLIELTLPRRLTGTTVIVSDEGLIGNLKTRWRADALERVPARGSSLREAVRGVQQRPIESRALLTPAFMERFTSMAERTGFSLPGARAAGNRLVVALPKRMSVDLFEPPVYWKPAGGKVLLDLNRDIGAVLDMADAVIDLDFWASGRKRDALVDAARTMTS